MSGEYWPGPDEPEPGALPAPNFYPADHPSPASDGLTCPECGGADFELRLGGQRSGSVTCRTCGALVDPGPAPRGPGRPPIGKPVNVRMPDELRERVERAALPGEALADTVRRLLALAADLPPSAIGTAAEALMDRASERERLAKGRGYTGDRYAEARATIRGQAAACRELAGRLASHLPAGVAPPLTVAEAFPNRQGRGQS